MPSPKPQALLFDLGGVLVDFDFGRALQVWAPYSAKSLDELKLAFTFDVPYQQHERGEISAAQYFDYLARHLQLSASPAEMERGWNSIFKGEFAQTRAMVQTMRQHLPCLALSNTNALHMATCGALYPEVVGAFDRIFTSHEMGMRKPERAAFEHISQATGIEAGDILFFDDLLENVQAAADAGLQAVQVRSPEDVRQALTAHGYTV